MANANANRTMALGSEDYLTPRRGLPSPSSASVPGMGGPAIPPLRTRTGMDYTGKYRTGPANFQPGRGIGVPQIMAQRENRPNMMNDNGSRVSASQGPITMGGWSGRSGQQGGRIGSAAGALGSSGIPTSQRGRLEKYGVDPMTGEGAWQMPSWMVGQQQRNQFGMTPDWSYGGMGKLPINSAQPLGSTSGSSPKPADSSTSTKPDPWGDRTTYGNNPISAGSPGMGKRLIGPAVSAIGGMMGIPGSFFGTSVADMLNRQKLW